MFEVKGLKHYGCELFSAIVRDKQQLDADMLNIQIFKYASINNTFYRITHIHPSYSSSTSFLNF